MGLDKLREMGASAILRHMSHWRVPLIMTLFSAGIALAEPASGEILRYDRAAIEAGELWRLVSGHFVHLGNAHLWLNLAGLALVWLLVGHRYRDRDWWLVVLMTIAGIDLGFWFVDANLQWYVGLSGLLHGMLLAGAVAGFRNARTESIIIVSLVALKLVWEQTLGPLPGSESSAGGDVIVNAHLYGAISGAVMAFPLWHRVRAEAPI